MERDEGGIFSKAPGNFCFYLKYNETQAVQIRNIMQSSSIFIRLSGPIQEVKKSALINENIIAYWEESEKKQVVSKQVWFIPNTYGECESRCHLRKIWLFFLLFKLGNSIPST